MTISSNINFSNNKWLGLNERNVIADKYKHDFHEITSQTKMIEDHSSLSSFFLIKGSHLLSFKQIPEYRDVSNKLIQNTDITAPIYFISHRWSSPNHPDPKGIQLNLLKSKIDPNAYYWIDYTCLPQKPRTSQEEKLFRYNIMWLPSFMFNQNFIILRFQDDGYSERAWCFLELLGANVLGRNIQYISDGSIYVTDMEKLERKFIEKSISTQTLIKGLGVTEISDLESIVKAASTIAKFFELRIIEHFMALGQIISNGELFFGEDPYYFIATCDFYNVLNWSFEMAKKHNIKLIELSKDYIENNFFQKLAEMENVNTSSISPGRLPKEIILSNKILHWFRMNVNKRDNYTNIFRHISSTIKVRETNSNSLWYDRGNNLSKSKKWDEAIGCYNQAILLDTKNEQAWNDKGVALLELNMLKEALDCFEYLIKLDSSNSKAWANKGIVLKKLNRIDESLICYRKAIEINPQDSISWNNIGLVLSTTNNRLEALKAFENALNLNPNFVNAWINKGNSLLDLGRFKECIESQEQAIILSVCEPLAWFNKGCAHGALNHFEEEIRCYNFALKLDSNRKDIWLNKGIALMSLEKFNESISCFENAINLKHNYSKAWYCKGAAQYSIGSYRIALKDFTVADRLGHPNAINGIQVCKKKLNIE